MNTVWESAYDENDALWAAAPAPSAVFASRWFAAKGVNNVLIPGFGYGRNARPFLDQGMDVTGIEVSGTAIAIARSRFGLRVPIHHGAATDMPFDDNFYGGVFCAGLLYLLDKPQRETLLRNCYRQLAPGGSMVFTLISKDAPMYGQGTKLGRDWYEILPGMRMFFYDEESATDTLAPYGLEELFDSQEPVPGGTFPFLVACCTRR